MLLVQKAFCLQGLWQRRCKVQKLFGVKGGVDCRMYWSIFELFVKNCVGGRSAFQNLQIQPNSKG